MIRFNALIQHTKRTKKTPPISQVPCHVHPSVNINIVKVCNQRVASCLATAKRKTENSPQENLEQTNEVWLQVVRSEHVPALSLVGSAATLWHASAVVPASALHLFKMLTCAFNIQNAPNECFSVGVGLKLCTLPLDHVLRVKSKSLYAVCEKHYHSLQVMLNEHLIMSHYDTKRRGNNQCE